MNNQLSSISEVALHLEAATAQLRLLSTFPEAQREDEVKKAVDDIKNRVSVVEEKIEKLSSEIQLLRETMENRMKALEAAAYNDKMRLSNKYRKGPHAELRSLHHYKTNETIPSFPETATDIRSLDEEHVERIALALGWNISGATLCGKRELILAMTGFVGF
ncbi:hypothetical protein EJ02DRAFT_383824 [Clathrospora elynae]|uniref:Uncharacterized protein n=1 Tax=Clathrospora elynae TaxID=706981 RepID=A0A6A5SEX8_9PLEO|nr:hypothetical protein EJ02DRAFT_383824 [Clathrospora elynae]